MASKVVDDKACAQEKVGDRLGCACLTYDCNSLKTDSCGSCLCFQTHATFAAQLIPG